MSSAYHELSTRSPALSHPSYPRPKLLSLGGDHSIALAALRALRKLHGEPIAVVHFDAHLDTWHPGKYPSAWASAQSDFNHGSMFWIASQEGLIQNGSSAHAGLRTRLSGDGWGDFEDDDRQGFLRIAADEIDDFGPSGVVSRILERVGVERPVYLSFDIDVLDPGLVGGALFSFGLFAVFFLFYYFIGGLEGGWLLMLYSVPVPARRSLGGGLVAR